MAKNWTIIGLGVWVAMLPFLGFPGAWDTFFFVLSGFLIALISLLMVAKERIETSQMEDRDTTNTH